MVRVLPDEPQPGLERADPQPILEPTIEDLLDAQKTARPTLAHQRVGAPPEEAAAAIAAPPDEFKGGAKFEGVRVHRDALCPICEERIFDDKQQLLRAFVLPVTFEKKPTHADCFLPYIDESKLSILFKIRTYSIGDTIASTPTLRELRRRFPRSKINVLTVFPELFEYNPHVTGLIDMKRPAEGDLLSSHNFAIDSFNSDRLKHFSTHSVEFAAVCTFNQGMMPWDWGYELNYAPQHLEAAVAVAREHGIDPASDRCFLLNPHGSEWPTRDWGRHHMADLARELKRRYPEAKIVSVGGKRGEAQSIGKEMNNYVPLPEELGAIDLYGKLGLLEAAAFMDLPSSRLLVTPDTGTLHLAGSRPALPIVGVFTLIKSFIRTPVRHGKFGWKFRGVNAADPCNCTYAPKDLTGSFNFFTCPKLQFIQKTRARKAVPIAERCEGLRWNEPEARAEIPTVTDEAAFAELLAAREARYSAPSLPCFPKIDRVLEACEQLLVDSWQRPPASEVPNAPSS